MCWVAGCALVGMMLLTSADVVGRYVGYPIRGTFDIVGLLGTVVAALPLAYTQILKRHVATEFMAIFGSKSAQVIANILVCLLSMGAYVVISWRCFVLGTKYWAVGRVSDTIEIPIYPFTYVLAFGCILISLVLLADLYSVFAEPKRGNG
jgi:TRAP-type C4-dicarboxylate transport system permease small subunit